MNMRKYLAAILIILSSLTLPSEVEGGVDNDLYTSNDFLGTFADVRRSGRCVDLYIHLEGWDEKHPNNMVLLIMTDDLINEVWDVGDAIYVRFDHRGKGPYHYWMHEVINLTQNSSFWITSMMSPDWE